MSSDEGPRPQQKTTWESAAYIMDPYMGVARNQNVGTRKAGDESRHNPGSPEATLLPKRSRKSSRPSVCQVDGCSRDLGSEKAYLQRYSVCEQHFKADVALLHGQEVRFCQQCNKFQDLREFDGARRSCAARSKDRNLRRRLQSTQQSTQQPPKGAPGDDLLLSNALLLAQAHHHRQQQQYGMQAGQFPQQQQQQQQHPHHHHRPGQQQDQQSGSPGSSGQNGAGGAGGSDNSGGRAGSRAASLGGSGAADQRAAASGGSGSSQDLRAATAGGTAAARMAMMAGEAEGGQGAAHDLLLRHHSQQQQPQPTGSLGRVAGPLAAFGGAVDVLPLTGGSRGFSAGDALAGSSWPTEQVAQSFEAALPGDLAGGSWGGPLQRRFTAAAAGGGTAMEVDVVGSPAGLAHQHQQQYQQRQGLLALGLGEGRSGGLHGGGLYLPQGRSLAQEGGGATSLAQEQELAAFARKLATGASLGAGAGGGGGGGMGAWAAPGGTGALLLGGTRQSAQAAGHMQTQTQQAQLRLAALRASGLSLHQQQHQQQQQQQQGSSGLLSGGWQGMEGGGGGGSHAVALQPVATLGGSGSDDSAAALLEQLHGGMTGAVTGRGGVSGSAKEAGFAAEQHQQQQQGRRPGVFGQQEAQSQQQQQQQPLSAALGQQKDDLAAMVRERRAALIRQQLLRQQHQQQQQRQQELRQNQMPLQLHLLQQHHQQQEHQRGGPPGGLLHHGLQHSHHHHHQQQAPEVLLVKQESPPDLGAYGEEAFPAAGFTRGPERMQLRLLGTAVAGSGGSLDDRGGLASGGLALAGEGRAALAGGSLGLGSRAGAATPRGLSAAAAGAVGGGDGLEALSRGRGASLLGGLLEAEADPMRLLQQYAMAGEGGVVAGVGGSSSLVHGGGAGGMAGAETGAGAGRGGLQQTPVVGPAVGQQASSNVGSGSGDGVGGHGSGEGRVGSAAQAAGTAGMGGNGTLGHAGTLPADGGGNGGTSRLMTGLFPGAGGREDALAARICLKLFNCMPEDLPGDMLLRLRRWAQAAESDVLQIFMRPGCVHVIANLRLSGGGQGAVERAVLGGGELGAAVAALRGAFESSGLLRGRRVVVQAAEGAKGAFEYDGSSSSSSTAAAAMGGGRPREARWVDERLMARAPGVVRTAPAAIPCGEESVLLLTGHNLRRPGTRFYARCGGRSLELLPVQPQPTDDPSAAVAAACGDAVTRLLSLPVLPAPTWEPPSPAHPSQDVFGRPSSPDLPRCYFEPWASPEPGQTPQAASLASDSRTASERGRVVSGDLSAEVEVPEPASEEVAAAAAQECSRGAAAPSVLESVLVHVPAVPRHGLVAVEAVHPEVEVMGSWAAAVACQDPAAAAELDAWLRHTADAASARWLALELGVLLDYDSMLPDLLQGPPSAVAAASSSASGPATAAAAVAGGARRNSSEATAADSELVAAGGGGAHAADVVALSSARNGPQQRTQTGEIQPQPQPHQPHQQPPQQQQQQQLLIMRAQRVLTQQCEVPRTPVVASSPLPLPAGPDASAISGAAGSALSALGLNGGRGGAGQQGPGSLVVSRPDGSIELRLLPSSSATAAAASCGPNGRTPPRPLGALPEPSRAHSEQSMLVGLGSGAAPGGDQGGAGPAGQWGGGGGGGSVTQREVDPHLHLSDDTKVPDTPLRTSHPSLRRLLAHPLLHPRCRRDMRNAAARLLAYGVASGLPLLATGLLEWLMALEAPGMGMGVGLAGAVPGGHDAEAGADTEAGAASTGLSSVFCTVARRAATATGQAVLAVAAGMASGGGGDAGESGAARAPGQLGLAATGGGTHASTSSTDSSLESGTGRPGGGVRGMGAGFSLMHLAVASGSSAMVQQVLDWAEAYGAPWPLDQPAGLNRVTPLHLAAHQRDGGAIARLLLSVGGAAAQEAWLTVRDGGGDTPADIAAAVGLAHLNYFAVHGEDPAPAPAIAAAAGEDKAVADAGQQLYVPVVLESSPAVSAAAPAAPAASTAGGGRLRHGPHPQQQQLMVVVVAGRSALAVAMLVALVAVLLAVLMRQSAPLVK